MKTNTQVDFTLCPKFEQAFSILGKKWNGLIIDVLLEQGPQRFVQLSRYIPEVSDRVLTERLKELEAEGIITRKTLCDESKRTVYQLTEKGRDLEKVMLPVHKWSEKWVK